MEQIIVSIKRVACYVANMIFIKIYKYGGDVKEEWLNEVK